MLPRWSDHDVEQVIGRTLQIGVLVAAAIVAVGAAAVLARHGRDLASYRVFNPGPEGLRSLGGIVRGVLALNARSIVQLGLLLLIATPVARVALTLVAFLVQRDRLYVVVTTIVLALLLYGLIAG